MKLSRMLMLLPVITLVMVSCKGKDPADMNEDGVTREEKKQDRGEDAEFLRDAAAINIEEIRFAELAENIGTMADTKEMAKMMSADHKKSLAEVTALAATLGVALPTSPDNEADRKYENLSKKEGVEFDKEYADMMVKGHKDAIDRFEKAVNNCEDQAVVSYASNSLLTLREHLSHAEHCQGMAKEAK